MFFDYKALSQQTLCNKSKDNQGNVNWLKIKWFKYEKINPSKILYKYDYGDEFHEIDVCGKKRGRRSSKTPVLATLFTEAPAISDVLVQ